MNKTIHQLSLVACILLSHNSANKSWWFYFHHISQNCIFLIILISIALVQGVIIFLLNHKLFCLPPGKLLFHLIRNARTICKCGQAEGARSNEVSMALYKLFWEGDEIHGKVSSIKTHMITVIFYPHHIVLTLHIPTTENVQCCFPSSWLCWLFYFCISSFILHFSLASEELGSNILWILLHFFPLKTSKSWRRGKSGYLFPWLLSSQDMVWQ